ncbi:MAG TPA: 50S ribosomal protein L13 [Candidatus Pacearchaeota archaeon]|nr:50S ribosomal protein L13 [Candidatus Pacearchaeota archaeon]HOK94265.1 50S ribosomal protein L13 [Candidatus Pacearchaeota archaeon]HPO75379.1 50S ribosomal protein L13 [Candidatus Pacearchaeota archaeon]
MKIDATNQSLGRLASEIAKVLQGKNKPTFEGYKAGDEVVEVENVDKMKITGKKMKQKIYYHYSGYPGGLKKITLEELFKEDPSLALKKAVWGMLPKNKLRKERIKRLKFI